MIPQLVEIDPGLPWHYLPPGIHGADLAEVEQRFAFNPHRQRLFDGFQHGCALLWKAGCRTVYLDGSFTSDKPFPNDYDVAWDTYGVDINNLDPVFTDFRDFRLSQKSKLGGEYFPEDVQLTGGGIWLDFFQTEKETGKKKGILRIEVLVS